MVEMHFQVWTLLHPHAQWPTVISPIPFLTWITKIIAKPLPQFSSRNTFLLTQPYHFTATWDFHSWMMMENNPHNGFHVPSKSVTKTMSIASATVVATIQMDSTQPKYLHHKKCLDWAPVAQNAKSRTKTHKGEKLANTFFNILKLNFLIFFSK